MLTKSLFPKPPEMKNLTSRVFHEILSRYAAFPLPHHKALLQNTNMTMFIR